MSEFHVQVVKLGPFHPHPNADTLDITKVFDYTVVVKRGAFKEGQLAVYVPIDSVVPDDEQWHWLAPLHSDGSERFPVGQVPEKYRVIEAKKIRGIFSQGCLCPLPTVDPGVAELIKPYVGDDLMKFDKRSSWVEGMDVARVLGITKYEPPVPMTMGGECEAGPVGWTFPSYTDIEGMRRYPNIIQEGEEVVITEKLHGSCGRYVHDGNRLWVGSHHQIKKRDEKSVWWQVANVGGFDERLAQAPFHVFFGEVYGAVQDLKYGIGSGCRFRVFDVYDVKAQRYLDHDDADTLADNCDMGWVPVLYRGPWLPELVGLSEGKSVLADHVREGIVVKPVKERWNDEVGRVVLKRHGEGYLLRKKK